MDALKGIGHACGHNLIAIAGVAVACALKDAMEKFDIAGTVKLLGTPGELIRRDSFPVTILIYNLQPKKAGAAKSFYWRKGPTKEWMFV